MLKDYYKTKYITNDIKEIKKDIKKTVLKSPRNNTKLNKNGSIDDMIKFHNIWKL
tara:strand:+ start:167 stop:331 length:165 start_codon:yes stop_codon:yes gene_type:complete